MLNDSAQISINKPQRTCRPESGFRIIGARLLVSPFVLLDDRHDVRKPPSHASVNAPVVSRYWIDLRAAPRCGCMRSF